MEHQPPTESIDINDYSEIINTIAEEGNLEGKALTYFKQAAKKILADKDFVPDVDPRKSNTHLNLYQAIEDFRERVFTPETVFDGRLEKESEESRNVLLENNKPIIQNHFRELGLATLTKVDILKNYPQENYQDYVESKIDDLLQLLDPIQEFSSENLARIEEEAPEIYPNILASIEYGLSVNQIKNNAPQTMRRILSAQEEEWHQHNRKEAKRQDQEIAQEQFRNSMREVYGYLSTTSFSPDNFVDMLKVVLPESHQLHAYVENNQFYFERFTQEDYKQLLTE